MPQTVAALGEQALLAGFQLAGAELYAAETEEDVRRAWALLPRTVGVVILTPRAAGALGPALSDPAGPMTVVLPS
jgi:vacuolar-type H+-ATPase subunit F/Vma7